MKIMTKNFGPMMKAEKMKQQNFIVIIPNILKKMITYHFSFKIYIFEAYLLCLLFFCFFKKIKLSCNIKNKFPTFYIITTLFYILKQT